MKTDKWDNPLIILKEGQEIPMETIFNSIYVVEKRAREPLSKPLVPFSILKFF